MYLLELSGSQAQQYYRDKILKIRVEKTHYKCSFDRYAILSNELTETEELFKL